MRKLRREEAFARSRGRGGESASAVPASQMRRPGPVHQVSVAAGRGIQSHAFNIPRDTQSPILQRLRDGRADRQEEASAAVGKKDGDNRSKQARVDDVSDYEEMIKPQTISVEVRTSDVAKSSPPPTPELFPDMKAEMSNSDWVKPFISNPPPCVLTEEEAAKECDEMASKAREMWTTKLRSLNRSPRELPGNNTMKPGGNAKVVHAEARKSSGSISSESSSEENDSICYSSDESFEVLEVPKTNKSERNGARRKWYKVYHR
jgi:hypothetical protein